MRRIEQDLYSIITAPLGDAGGGFGGGGFGTSSLNPVTNIVGTRIYPVVLPTQPTLPAIHYRIVGGSSTPTNDTYGNQRYRFEVNCWGLTYLDAVTLRSAVIQTLQEYGGAGVSIRYIQPLDLYESELRQYRCIAEFYVYFNFAPN